jgi:hypothetical protein
MKARKRMESVDAIRRACVRVGRALVPAMAEVVKGRRWWVRERNLENSPHDQSPFEDELANADVAATRSSFRVDHGTKLTWR